MVYPILTDIFHAQWIFNDASALPEDQYINNWYFRNDFPFPTPTTNEYQIVQDAIAAVLTAFYTQLNTGATATVESYLSPNIASATLKVYDLGFGAPRYPIVDPTEIAINTTGSPMPNEVACCLSFKGGNGPRRRGRVYIGPLNEGAIGGNGRPTPGLQNALGFSAVNVLNTTEDVTWVVVSPTSASSVEVTDGWVDDAFDTQRSRGRAPTSRVLWPV